MCKNPFLRLPIVIWLGLFVARVSSVVSPVNSIVRIPRAGASSGEAKKKRKNKAKKPVDLAKEKEAIQEALKEKDSATALGDAIRDRTDDWLETDPLFSRIDCSVSSVGWAMGTSDDGGSVEAAPSSVLAHYFLKSHGGAHALQSVCSLLAFLLSMGAVCLPRTPTLQKVLLKRAMLCAMTKHLAGLLAATGMTASSIPKIGLGQARRWMERLARDPVSQYVLYTALLMVWLSSTPPTVEPWYNALPVLAKYVPLLLVGPVLLREAISTMFVLSDVVLLLQTSTESKATAVWWTGCQAVMNAIMSLLVTPNSWRASTASQRQAILAKLTAKTSLVMELLTGMLIVMDAAMAILEFAMLTPRPKLLSVGQRLLCARLYVNFLWVRRTKIRSLGHQLRGGAAQVPVRILDALYDPFAAMGIEKKDLRSKDDKLTWKDYAVIGLGLD